MNQTVTLNSKSFSIVHRTNKKIKRVSLELTNSDEIIVKTPLKFPVHLIKQIVYDHQEWILKAIQRVPVKNRFDFVTGGVIPYLGINYTMELREDENYKNVKFEKSDEMFVVYHNQNSSYDDFIAGLKQFYKFQAKKVIDPLFEHYSNLTQLYPTKVSYRSAKTRWGSCSFENSISINYHLLQFDIKAIEYVVLHELCHIEQKNHSKKFWDLVSFYMPEYKQIQATLKGKLF